MASPLLGMEYRVIKDYGNGDMIILPVFKFDGPGQRKLIFVRDGQLLGKPQMLEQGEDEQGLAWAVARLEKSLL
jgi:hypothetical protein